MIRQTKRDLSRVLETINRLFSPGTPMAAKTFLQSVCECVEADSSLLALNRAEDGKRSLVPVNHEFHNWSTKIQQQITEVMKAPRIWNDDPIAQRILKRCRRRSNAPFTFTIRQLAHGATEKESYCIAFLKAIGSVHELTSLLPVGGGHYSMLTVYRTRASSKPFAYRHKRILKLLHHTFAERVIDLRQHRVREQLPKALRQTFVLMLAGQSEKEIALTTFRSRNTVHDHIKRIYAHFGVSSRPQLLALFIDFAKLQQVGVDGHLIPDEV